MQGTQGSYGSMTIVYQGVADYGLAPAYSILATSTLCNCARNGCAETGGGEAGGGETGNGQEAEGACTKRNYSWMLAKAQLYCTNGEQITLAGEPEINGDNATIYISFRDKTTQQFTTGFVEVDCGNEEQKIISANCLQGTGIPVSSSRFTSIQKLQSNVNASDETPTEAQKGVYTINGTGIDNYKLVVKNDNATLFYYKDANQDGIWQADEEILDPAALSIQISKTADLIDYSFDTGWNLVGLEIVSEDWDKASTLLEKLNDDGIEASHLATYVNGKWKLYTHRKNLNQQDVTYGEDFTLVPGGGYFIKTLFGGMTTLEGKKFEESVPIDLLNGWNLISIQSPDQNYTAESFIDTCVNKGVTCDTVSRYESGRYDSVIKQDSILYGNDFNIVSLRGYFIRVKEGGGVRLTP